MLIDSPYGSTLSDAFKLASERGILPTWMGAAEIKELEEGIKARAVFSARTTHAGYLQALRDGLNKLIEGGYGSTEAEIRLFLKNTLREIGYDPVTGFPGDEAFGIPPAKPGSLRDLSSDKRINLILDTQTQLMAGKGQQQRGLEPAALDLFPAYELVRVRNVRMPRDWLKRWKIAADNVDWEGVASAEASSGRMVALKSSPVWAAIGSHHLFDDALDVAHPPFAFNSGMGWNVIERDEAEQLGLMVDAVRSEAKGTVAASFAEALGKQTADPELARTMRALHAGMKLPPAVASTHGLDADFVSALQKKISGVEAHNGKLTLKDIIAQDAERDRVDRGVRVNVLCDGLDCLLLLKTELNAGSSRGAFKGWQTRRSGAAKEAAKGMQAMNKVIASKQDVLDAMQVPGLGAIDFRWSVGQRGIQRIHEDHEIARRVPWLLARGKVTKGKSRAFVDWKGHRVVLANNLFGKPANHWVLTGYRNKKKRHPTSP